jgi:hypothetical protein
MGLTEKERRVCEEIIKDINLPEQGFHLIRQEFKRVGIELEDGYGSSPNWLKEKKLPVRGIQEYPDDLKLNCRFLKKK